MLRILAGVLVGLMVLVATASAGIPDPDLSWVDVGPDLGMTSCPDGDGPVFEYITVTAHRTDDTPIEGIPSTSFFFTVTGGNVTITAVDAESNASGEIRFDMVADETIELLDPNYLTIECQIYTIVLNDIDYVEVNSVDLNGDGCVGLADFSQFSAVYSTTDPRADYNWDGSVGLADFSVFSQHYGHGCP
jgi:hypothetical protein